MSDIKILVASHKAYWMPNDGMYLPIQVGAVGKGPIPSFARDDYGESISKMNPRYCELTALFWGWKNLNVGSTGLVHYRRYFSGTGERGILTAQEATHLLEDFSVILPKKRHYVIETIESHYAHTFDESHIQLIRDVLDKRCPEGLVAFECHMRRRSAHMYNMFIMKKNYLSEYCEWLFPILFEMEECIDFANMTTFEARCMGRLAELLVDVWIDLNGIRYVEVPVVNLEPVNWVNKGTAFLAAKFLKKRYEKSF